MVKNQYKKLMNQFAQEAQMEQGGQDQNSTTGENTTDKPKTSKKKKDKKKKKDRSKMTDFELKIEDQKDELRRIYDCLMYQQCMI